MQWNRIPSGKRWLTVSAVLAAVALAVVPLPPGAGAQSKSEDAQPGPAKPATPTASETIQTLFLVNASDFHDLNDIQTDLRNVLPKAKIFGVQTQNAITVQATPEDLATAQKLVADLDQPRKLYRLTYTITDFDSGKPLGSHHFVILAALGQKSTFKQGSRVPIETGTIAGQPPGTQMQYQDVGLSIEARVSGSPDALYLHTKIEQSSLAEQKSAPAPLDPVVHQTALDESSELAPGKPLVLGSFDLPGTTRSQKIEVFAELVR